MYFVMYDDNVVYILEIVGRRDNGYSVRFVWNDLSLGVPSNTFWLTGREKGLVRVKKASYSDLCIWRATNERR